MHGFLERAAAALHDSAGRLTVAELTHHAEGQWSIAETIEHLARAFSGTTRGLARALADGRPGGSRPSIRSRAGALLVIELGYFPRGRQSPKVARPVGIEPAEALPLALENLRAMDDALARAATEFGTRVMILDHPIIGPLNVRQWRKFHWIHTRHHVRQILGRRTRV
jgi:hypothetical protein